MLVGYDLFANVNDWTLSAPGTLSQPSAGIMRIVGTLGANTGLSRSLPNLSLLGGRFISFEMLLEGGVSAVRVSAGGAILHNHSSSFFTAGEWRRVTVAGAEVNAAASALASVKTLGVTLLNSGGTPTAQFRNFRYVEPHFAPGVLWLFDDARKNTYDVARPIMERYGHTGIVGVPPHLVGTAGYMTEADLHSLEAAGWEMVCHGYDHVSLTSADAATRTNEIRLSRAWLIDHGFNAESARHYVYPSASFDASVVDLLASEGVITARSGQPRQAVTPLDDDKLRLKSRFLQDNWSVAETLPYLDNVAERGGIVSLTAHSLEVVPSSGNWYIDRFEQVAAHAKALGLRAYKCRELWPA